MPGLVKVLLLAAGGTVAMVEYNNVRYEVFVGTLQNCLTEQTYAGFVTHCWINPIFLTKVWR